MTLYRKYRPQKLAELDNEEVRERLVTSLSSSYTPHALLFAGPKGTGKTSAARIVAKVLNCEVRIKNQESSRVKGSAIEPCDKCETCISITEGRNLDVLEIDAASNRGIDEIRELREKIKLAPVSARFKVYIIDEVHMLTNEAFNALLKTLEEPPPHAVFILATTEPDKLPQTITSRCLNFHFNKATIAEVVNCLKRVVAGEKVKIADELLTLIADSADGSFRDATKILEQAILEEALTVEKLKKIIGREALSAEKFLNMVASGKLEETLSEVEKMSTNGVNFRFFVEDILKLLHSLLLVQHGIEEACLPARREKLNADLSKSLSTANVLTLIRLFSKVYVELKSASIVHLPLEVAVVEWCQKKGGVNV